MRVRLACGRSRVRSSVRQHSFVEIGHDLIYTAILSLLLIQVGQLSVTGERMCTRLGSLSSNSVLTLTDRLDMTIVVDWDLKPHTHTHTHTPLDYFRDGNSCRCPVCRSQMHKTPIHRFSLTFIFADRPYVVRFDLHPGNGNMKSKLTSFTILRNQNYHNCLNTIQTLCKTVKISLLHHQPVSYRINLHMSSWLSIRKSAKFNKLLISMACLCFRTTRCVRMFLSICSMFPLAFVAVWLQGHWWDFISRNYVVWPTFLLMNVFTALKGSHFWFLFDFTAAGVVPYGGRKTSPRTSTIVQFIFWEIRNKWLV